MESMTQYRQNSFISPPRVEGYSCCEERAIRGGVGDGHSGGGVRKDGASGRKEYVFEAIARECKGAEFIFETPEAHSS